MARADYQYTVHLEVRLDGPKRDWDAVANALADRVRVLPRHRGVRIESVDIDTATEPEEDDTRNQEARA